MQSVRAAGHASRSGTLSRRASAVLVPAAAVPSGAGEDGASHDGLEDHEAQPLLGGGGPSSSRFSCSSAAEVMRRCDEIPVYPLVHLVRADVRRAVDTHLSYDELTSVDINFAIVRPLALKYARLRCLAILFALLLNRCQFQRDAERDLAFLAVNQSRAALCELLAIKLLRTFSRDGIELITALTAPFSPLAGAEQGGDDAEDDDRGDDGRDDGPRRRGMDPATKRPSHRRQQPSNAFDGGITSFSSTSRRHDVPAEATALELALHSSAKKFVSSPLCQRVVSAIWTGKIVVTATPASHAIVQDAYKARRPLSIYDPARSPLLDHYRLRVPMIRSRLEFLTLCVLAAFYIGTLNQKLSPVWTAWETLFTIWLVGYALDEVAQFQEHGAAFYLGSLWNLLDSLFCGIGLTWLVLRAYGLRYDDAAKSETAFDLLSLGAILLFPRVLSALFQDDPVLLALKAMIGDFCRFFALAMVAMCGFLFSFWSLGDHKRWTVGKIGWLMAKIWFGNSYVGFDTAQEFSPVFGPPLMVVFAITANTLLLTVLISILSSTYQMYQGNAAEEAMFQHATHALARLSTEALMSYIPPLNIIGFAVIYPSSFFLDAHRLHQLNVGVIRLLSWPILLGIRFLQTGTFSSRVSRASGVGRRIGFDITEMLTGTRSGGGGGSASRGGGGGGFIWSLPSMHMPLKGSSEDKVIEAAFGSSDDEGDDEGTGDSSGPGLPWTESSSADASKRFSWSDFVRRNRAASRNRPGFEANGTGLDGPQAANRAGRAAAGRNDAETAPGAGGATQAGYRPSTSSSSVDSSVAKRRVGPSTEARDATAAAADGDEGGARLLGSLSSPLGRLFALRHERKRRADASSSPRSRSVRGAGRDAATSDASHDDDDDAEEDERLAGLVLDHEERLSSSIDDDAEEAHAEAVSAATAAAAAAAAAQGAPSSSPQPRRPPRRTTARGDADARAVGTASERADRAASHEDVTLLLAKVQQQQRHLERMEDLLLKLTEKQLADRDT